MKIALLFEISVNGTPDIIGFLLQYLKTGDLKVKHAAAAAIVRLFKKIDSKYGYYDTLKYCDIKVEDIDRYQAGISPDQFVTLLAICSMNRNGRVREKAVGKLADTGDPRSIRFLVYRLADWVLPVREAAVMAIERYKTSDFTGSLIENLLVFKWLEKVQRVELGHVYNDLMRFIVQENRLFMLSNFTSYPDKIRLLLAQYISGSISENGDELRLILSDKNFMVRNLAVEKFELLDRKDIRSLLVDKSSKVRLDTLYKMMHDTDFEKEIINHIADRSAAVRNFVRFYTKWRPSDFAGLYIDNIEKKDKVAASLAGLAEINAIQHSDKVADFLNDDSLMIRTAAFLALRKLDPTAAYTFAISQMDSSYTRIRRAALNFLITHVNPDVLAKARELYPTSLPDVKKSLVNFFGAIGGWKTLPDLILASIDQNEPVRNLAAQHLTRWKANAVNLFSDPTQPDRERAQRLLVLASEIHADKYYFKTSLLEGIEFYINR